MLLTEIFIISSLSIASINQSNTTLYYTQADSLYKTGNFEQCIIACEKYLYFNPTSTQRPIILFKKAKAYQQLGLYDYSSSIFISIPIWRVDTSFYAIIRYNMAINSYMTNNFDQANIFINEAFSYKLPDTLQPDAELLMIVIKCEMQQWDSARFIIQKSSNLTNEKKDTLLQYLKNPPKTLTLNKLEWYSRLIPGSGQIVSGYTLEGITSFLLCASALTLGIYQVIAGYYITGYFFGAGLLHGFHSGGLRRLKLIVETENHKRIKKFNETIFLILKQPND